MSNFSENLFFNHNCSHKGSSVSRRIKLDYLLNVGNKYGKISQIALNLVPQLTFLCLEESKCHKIHNHKVLLYTEA